MLKLQDGFSQRGDETKGAEMPLEIADPENKFGEGRRAGVELDAEELVRIDGLGADGARTALAAAHAAKRS